MDTFFLDHVSEANTRCADGVRMSSSIPLFYAAIFRDENVFDPENPEHLQTLQDCIMDGGTMDNFPVHILREQGVPENQIMGLKLCGPDELTEYNSMRRGARTSYGEVEDLKECLVRLIKMLRKNAMNKHVHKGDWKLTVKIDVGDMSSTDFDMTEEEKQWLYDQGRAAMDKYVEEVAERLKNGEEF